MQTAFLSQFHSQRNECLNLACHSETAACLGVDNLSVSQFRPHGVVKRVQLQHLEHFPTAQFHDQIWQFSQIKKRKKKKKHTPHSSKNIKLELLELVPLA